MIVNYCLTCQDVVGKGSEYHEYDGINPDYEGMRIHYGQDWYCGPVVEIDEEDVPSKLLYESILQEIYG